MVIFPLLALVLLAGILLTRAPGEASTATQLTTYGTGPYAARGVYEVLQRVGFHVSRRRTTLRPPLDSTATYLLLDPPMAPSATGVHALLDAVRRGATAIVVPAAGTPLADSVGVRQSFFQTTDLEVRTGATDESVDEATAALRAAAARLPAMNYYLRPVPRSDSDTAPPLPAHVRVLVRVSGDSASEPAILARPMGRGWVVALSDAEWLANETVRDTAAAIAAVRLVEWPAPAVRRPLVFDEYHQGFGQHVSLPQVVVHALVGTPAGRAFLQLVAAGLVLLVALGVRPIAPLARVRIERRSPLEHVGALARAYEQVRATRTATQRLLHGLRRRHPLGLPPSADDARYLDLLRVHAPSVGADIALVREALAQPVSAADWVRIGGAIDHIERTIRQ